MRRTPRGYDPDDERIMTWFLVFVAGAGAGVGAAVGLVWRAVTR